jgi:nickel transport protein
MRRAAALLLLALAPAAASGHEVLHRVASGRAIAVQAFEPDGEPLAACEYQVFSPADPGTPWATGRTDRAGWLAFVPAIEGAWRVRVIDPTGHGLDLAVPAGAAEVPRSAGDAARGAGLLRLLAGAAAIGAVFGLLALLRRRRGAAP